jgi:ribonuclease R
VFVDGLVHITALGNDYFHFDAARHQLLGDRTRASFRLGDAVRVRVMRVDLDEAQIDFELAAKPEPGADRSGRSAAQPGKRSPKRGAKRGKRRRKR